MRRACDAARRKAAQKRSASLPCRFAWQRRVTRVTRRTRTKKKRTRGCWRAELRGDRVLNDFALRLLLAVSTLPPFPPSLPPPAPPPLWLSFERSLFRSMRWRHAADIASYFQLEYFRGGCEKKNCAKAYHKHLSTRRGGGKGRGGGFDYLYLERRGEFRRRNVKTLRATRWI